VLWSSAEDSLESLLFSDQLIHLKKNHTRSWKEPTPRIRTNLRAHTVMEIIPILHKNNENIGKNCKNQLLQKSES